MGKNFQADIPGNEYQIVVDTASAATNGASAKAVLFEAPAALIITEVAWIPTGGDQAGHGTSYRKISLIDGGAAGTGTTAVASLAMTSSHASLAPADLTVTSSLASIDDGDVILFSQTTVGGTKDSETNLKAGRIHVRYRLQ